MNSMLPRLVLLLSISATFIACNNKNVSNAADTKSTSEKESPKASAAPAVFDLLIGTWKTSDGKLFERWTKNDNGTYTSVVFSLKGSDTSWKERVNIYPENDKWVYENIVADQNAGQSVKFTSIFLTSNSVQFSNPAHDFPTDINYTLPDVNTVNAFIVGPDNKGGKDTIPFNYTREK
jgi:hypothetical protein